MELILGAFMPFIIDSVNKDITNSKLRFLISVILCLGVGIALNAPKFQYGNVADVLASASLVVASAQTSYKMFYENSPAQTIMRSGD